MRCYEESGMMLPVHETFFPEFLGFILFRVFMLVCATFTTDNLSLLAASTMDGLLVA